MPHKDKYEAQLALIKGENVNVGTKSELKDFFILLVGSIAVIIFFLSSFDFLSAIIIDKMSPKTQTKIESLFRINAQSEIPAKYVKKVIKLEKIKDKIVKNDKKIQGRSNFPINVVLDRDINAMIKTDGSLYLTSSFLNLDLNEEEIAFVLAHELGHYAHKDHLKSISKQTAFILFCLVTGLDGNVGSIAQGVSEIEMLSHSRRQEMNADLYANKMLIKIYGNNNGAISFIKKLEEKESDPTFLKYFSTHPTWKERLELAKNKV